MLSLNNFETNIDHRIAERGLNYFMDGLVQDILVSGSDYEATVKGSEDYEVMIRMKNGFVEHHDCDCPYNLGPVCKHVAAVLFAIREMNTAADPESDKPSKEKVKGKLSVSQLIDLCPEKELKEFLKTYSKKHVSFVTAFLNAFPQPQTNESVYRKQLKALLRKVSGRDGFIDWHAANSMARDINNLLEIAEQHQAKGKEAAVSDICIALMEELIEAINYADDSNGIIGNAIYFAFNALENLAIHSSNPLIRQHLVDFCLRNYKQKKFGGWDWHLGMLELAIILADNETITDEIRTLLKQNGDSEYERKNIQLLQFKLMKRSGDIKGAENFAKLNSSNDYLREELLKSAISSQDYPAAIQLAQDGIREDQKKYPGLAKKWQDWLLEVYIRLKDRSKIAEFAELLFLDGFLRERDYYGLLKENTLSEEWETVFESLVEKLSRQGNSAYRIAELYVREHKTDKLLELLSKEPVLHLLENYDKQLSKDYPDKLAALYGKALPDFLHTNVSRKYYQKACTILVRIRKLGANDLASGLIEQFRKEYPMRKALIEELNRL